VFLVSGRGELHLTILLENMRREGYELAVSRPQRAAQARSTARRASRTRMLTVDVEEQHQGGVMEALGRAAPN
jgi:GTP-binding protein